MEIIGYKAFKKGLVNKYGAPFELDTVYQKSSDTLKFGENGHGYHMTSKLADTFRFFNPTLDNVYCQVMGFGKVVKADDYLYDSDDMYVVEKFKILKVLSRDDIFEYILNADVNEFRRILELYPLTKNELKVLRELVITKDDDFVETFSGALERQQGDISSFKRNPKYLR